jgi:hypothetical protein
MLIATFLKRFFSVFSLLGARPASRKRSLSSLFKEISRKGPSWYDPWTDRLAEEFADAVERLRRSCARMAKVYVHAIDGPAGAAEEAAFAVLDSALAEGGASLASLSFEAIRNEVEAARAVDVLEAMDVLFQERLATLRSESAARAAAGYRTNQRLASLCHYRFAGLLGPFAPKMPGGKRRRRVTGEPLAAAVADLHYLIAGLKPDGDARRVFLELRKAANPEGYPAEIAVADFNSLSFVLGGPLRSDAVGRVAKAIRLDPDFVLRSDNATGDIRTMITEKATAEYNERRGIMADRIAKEALDARVFAVFGEAPLLPVEGWNEEISEALSKTLLPRLSHIQPLSILKSFMEASFFPRIRPAVADAIVDFDFSDRHFRATLSDEADDASRVAEDISHFEETVSSHGRSEFARIVAALEAEDPEKVGTILARRTIEEANALAERTLKNALSRFGALLSHLEAVRDDLKSRTPAIVLNAAIITAQKRPLVQGIDESARLLGLFLDLLRRVVSDSQETRASQAAAIMKR